LDEHLLPYYKQKIQEAGSASGCTRLQGVTIRKIKYCNVICFIYKYVELRSSFCSLRDAERYMLYHIVHPAAYSSVHCDVFEYLKASLDFEESEWLSQ